MPEFLQLIPPGDARAVLFQQLPAQVLRIEEILTENALGRITGEAVVAAESLPAFARSTVDGFAVRAMDTFGASDTLPAYLSLAGEVPMGSRPAFSLQPTQAGLIHTGGMLPDGADAVVMLEMTQVARPGEIEILKSVAAGENILRAGEDVAAGDEVLPAGTQLGAAEIGGLMALGRMQVKVVQKPRIAILSSGDEVIPPDQTPYPGQVRDINSYALAALVQAQGGEAVRYGILPDQREALAVGVRRAWEECDAVIVTAGSSASTRDLTADVIQSTGQPGVLVHGVNVKPGKPTILGVCDGKAVIGLPGNPVSALVIAGLFVTPLVRYLLGCSAQQLYPRLSARLAINLASQAGREDWVPVRLRHTDTGFDADPIFYKSNLIFTLARADGLVHIPADANGLAAGELVDVDLISRGWMGVYLHDIPLFEAQASFQQALSEAGLSGILAVEEIPLDENAVGRVLAEPVWARLSSPHYHASAMDGFAVRAAQIAGAMPTAPVTLIIGEQAAYVDTGDPLPDWANTVIPIENVEALDALDQLSADLRHPDRIRVRAGQTPWSHVRPLGEDIVATQLVLPAGQILRPVDLGALAAGGAVDIRVSRRPRVAVLPTGTELIPVGQSPKRGDIIEYNSIVLAGQIKIWGGEVIRYPISADNLEVICQRVQQAADTCDLVLLNAGSSAGSEDFSACVVEDLGRLLVHGVAVRPGHPVILGMIRRTRGVSDPERMVPIIGVPGYPVSAALTGEIFVEPLLAAWLGRAPARPVEVTACLTRKVTSPPGDDDYMRVVAGRVGDKLLAAPLSRGAGVITSLVKADGITILPRGVQGLEAGAAVQVRLYRAPHELEETIFAIGSHDMTLDLLAQYLAERGRRLVSANVGSQGGLVALSRGEAHLAGSHLLDPETGEYNLSSIRQYLRDIPVQLVTWVHREQGLLVARGNPKGIHGLQDLVRADLSFINRQRGAGTRVLLDFELKKLGILPSAVSGYDQEEYTHLAVAAAIASGRADCGLAVTAAARALDLDFIPLFHERYDLVIPLQHLTGGLLNPLFDLMQNPIFRQAVAAFPGYDVHEMGKIKIVSPI